MQALQNTIDNPNIRTVDGIRTVIVSEHNQFKYVEYVMLRGTPVPVRNEPNSPVHFGTAAEGSDHWHIGLFSHAGHGIFPVFSYTGKFRIIYHPEPSFVPEVCSFETPEQFGDLVRNRINEVHKRVLEFQSQF